jgi:hypothetical protein
MVEQAGGSRETCSLPSYVGRDVRIWQLGEGESRTDWERSLSGGGWLSGERLKLDDRGRGVWRAEMLGADVAVKARPMLGVLDRLRFRLGATDLSRACLGAAILNARGVYSPKVRVLALVRVDGAWQEVLVTEWAGGRMLLGLWVEGSDDDRRKLAALAGAAVGRLSSLCVFNRDCKPSNIVVDGLEVGFVDVGGVRSSGGDLAGELARMIGALGFEPTGVGARPTFDEVVIGVRAALGAAGVEPAQRRGVLKLVRELARAHGDPTPKDNPVAPAGEMR